MKLNEILTEALKPSEYRVLVKDWDKERYKKLFTNPKYKHDKNGYRIYIPIGKKKTIKKSPIQNEIERELSRNGFDLVDYQKGLVNNKKNGQNIKIGKVLTKLGLTDLLNKFTSDKTREAVNDDYVVIISRHPYDIAGMSTGRGWTSCMNLHDGSNAHYVPIDISRGSIVAYVTSSSDPDLKNPAGRVMIKPFVNIEDPDDKNFIYFGIENTVYGTNVPGFIDVVKKWVDEINAPHLLNDVMILQFNGGYDDSGRYINHDEDEDDVKPFFIGKNKEQVALARKIMRSPKSILKIDNPPDNLLMIALKQDPTIFPKIKNPSEKVIFHAIKVDGRNIQFIKNPSPKLIDTAVRSNGTAIRFIKNPSPELIKAAVAQTGFALQYIDNPSIELQKLAVKTAGYAIQYIDNPTDEMKMDAIRATPYSISMIDNPTDEMIRYALTHDVSINVINNPSDEIKLFAIEANTDNYRYISNPTPEMDQKAFDEEPTTIMYIKNQTEDMKLKAVEYDPDLIRYVDNPSEEIQLKAVGYDWSSIRHIQYPTTAVVKLATELKNKEQ